MRSAPRKARLVVAATAVLAAHLALAACTPDPDGGPDGAPGEQTEDGTRDPSPETSEPSGTDGSEPSGTDGQGGEPSDEGADAAPDDAVTQDAAPQDATTPVANTVPPGFSAPGSVLREDAFDGADLSVADVTVHENGDFVRLVYHLDGNGFPGWEVGYDKDPATGSDDAESVLKVMFQDVTGGDPAAAVPDGAQPVVEVETDTASSATSYVSIATSPQPFRVQMLTDPIRVVVDVSREGSR